MYYMERGEDEARERIKRESGKYVIVQTLIIE